jgi:hypothetical protein
MQQQVMKQMHLICKNMQLQFAPGHASWQAHETPVSKQVEPAMEQQVQDGATAFADTTSWFCCTWARQSTHAW